MGTHNNGGVEGRQYSRTEVIGMKIDNFLSIPQLAKIYACTESNVKQNILKMNRTTKKARTPKVDWVFLFPSDLLNAKRVDNESEERFVVCNDKLYQLLTLRSFILGKDLNSMVQEAGIKFVK